MFELACQERNNSSPKVVKCGLTSPVYLASVLFSLLIRRVTMPQKRGRPVSELSDDCTLNRQRQLAAARMRDLRRRQRPVYRTTVQPTPAQLQQGERIIDLGFTEYDAAETLAQLGLRTQGLTLAQDASNARLQQDAVPT
jgi:hypothetical protein